MQDSVALARNAVRPFFSRKKKAPYYKNIDTVRSLINASNVADVLHVVEGKPHFPFPGIGNTYPSDPGQIPLLGLNKIQHLPLEKEVLSQFGRINYHKRSIIEALAQIAEINKSLAKGDCPESVHDSIQSHVVKNGWSFAILRKLLLANLMHGGVSELSRSVHAITSRYERRVWGHYAHMLYDFMDPSYDPFSAIMAWQRYFRGREQSSDWYAILFTDLMDGHRVSRAQKIRGLMRFGNASLIDLALYSWKHFDVVSDDKSNSLLNEDISNFLEDNFQSITVSPSRVYLSADSDVSDLELYRVAIFFDEIRDISRWRADFNSLVGPSLDPHSVGLEIQSLFSKVNDASTTADRLWSLTTEYRTWQLSHFDIGERRLDQYLMRACVLASALRQNGKSLVKDREALAEAIASTDNVHEFVDEASLVGLLSNLESNDALDFILRDLIFKKIRSRDNDLERRLAFMNLVQSSGKSVALYIQDLALTRPAIANRIANVCTRTFLERLFLLMSSIRDVISTRIDICEWLNSGDKGTESIAEEIASLRRELANLDIRSDLDSTRIHVDEESLREWFWETQKSSVNRYIQTILVEGKGSGDFSLLQFLGSKEKSASADDVRIDAQLGSEHLLLAIFSATLNAFASDKSFGLDAYLSRRIRHGTLSGSIITPLSRVLKKFEEISPSEPSDLDDPAQDFVALTQQWRKSFAASLDDARKNIIQLESNSSRGLIKANWRTASNIAHVDAAISRIKARVLESRGVYDIFPDLYALCWDCIEPDLAQLRRYLLRELLPGANASLVTIWGGLTMRNRASAAHVMRQLNSTLQSKIQEVCGWFIRPVFRRDSYSLKMLVTSTLAIIRELDENYSFEEDVQVSDQLTLNRASFDVFGDLIFVVLGNAAKYGVRGGRINVTSEADNATSGELIIAVEVQSFVENKEAFDTAVSRIEKAMNIQDIEIQIAAVGEGFSGLGKAVGIMRHVRSNKAALIFDADAEKLDIRFAIYLPANIVANRSQ